VETDEKVRYELDRKDRVDYLKNKNFEELQKSFSRVKTSRSPARKSPSKEIGSTYFSPSRKSKYDYE